MSKLDPVDRMTPERRDELLKPVVKIIDRYGLYAPAAFFITLSKPVTFLGSQAMFMLSPILGAFVKEETVEDYAQLMTDRGNVEYLLNMLEEKELAERKKLLASRQAAKQQSKPRLTDRLKGIFRKS